jgi:hypothetical protein
MTWRDKLELGLKEDAGHRKDNLTPSEIRGPEIPMGPGRSPQIPMARDDKTEFAQPEPLEGPEDQEASTDDA